jgi:hypothetical protein
VFGVRTIQHNCTTHGEDLPTIVHGNQQLFACIILQPARLAYSECAAGPCCPKMGIQPGYAQVTAASAMLRRTWTFDILLP